MRVASFQSPVVYANPAANVEYALRKLEAQPGLDLAVFPEAFLTGYAAATREEGLRIAISDTAILDPLEGHSRRTGVTIVIGAIFDEGRVLRNRAYVISPTGTSFYDKTHLPFLGVDRFVTAGDSLPIFELPKARLGVLICYDQRMPEATRTLALRGIDILALPTNWPEGAEVSANSIGIARAAENKIFVITSNRVGTENGFRFIGQSRIIGPTGVVLAEAGSEETVLLAEISPEVARQKRTVLIPGEYEIDIMGARRPDLYGDCTQTYANR